MENKHKIEAVIFDVDGVLVNTVPYHFRAWKKIFNAFGISLTFDDYNEKLNGLPRMKGIYNVLGKRKVKDLAEAVALSKQKLFLLSIEKKPPAPLTGVIPFIEQLTKMNISIAAASSSKNAKTVLKMAKLDGYFKVIVCGNDFKKSKPHPDIFLTTARKLNVAADKTIVIEDAYQGAIAASKAGAIAVGILTTKDYNLRKNCRLVLSSLKDYRRVIEAYF